MTTTFSPVTGPEQDNTELITGEAVALDVRSASTLLRAAGAIIDVIATALVLLGIVYLVTILVGGTGADGATVKALYIATIAFCIVLLPALVETLSRGRSLGKFAVGLRVVRDDGGAIQFRHAISRSLVGILELYLTFGGLAAIVGLTNSKSKRLGDMIAGTYSQHERVPHVKRQVRPMPLELAHWAQIADVARMPEPLARRISQFLAEANRFTPESRERVAHELAAEAAVYASPIPPVHPEIFLVGAAAIRRERDARALDTRARRLEALAPALEGVPHGFPHA